MYDGGVVACIGALNHLIMIDRWTVIYWRSFMDQCDYIIHS